MFEIVGAEEWQLADQIGAERKRRLLDTEYGAIVRMITDHIESLDIRRTRSKCIPGTSRIEIKLALPARTVDLFHNGAGGYRAQFYMGMENGEKANRFLIDHLLDRLKTLCAIGSGEEVGWDFIEASLINPFAKAWIHQGAWMRQRKCSDRNLVVERWKSNAATRRPRNKNFKTWARLTPENETKLDIKGGNIRDNLDPVGFSPKPYRSQEIHDFGFT